MIKPAFVDLSHHNVRSFGPAKKQLGILGVIHKCTEGTTFADKMCSKRFAVAKKAKLLWGLYHFIRPGKITEQAHWFIKCSTKAADGNTLYALDYEDAGVSIDDCLDFMRIVEEMTGHQPVIYSGHVLKEALGNEANPHLSEYRLWLAQYTNSEPTLPPGWSKYWAWQYSDKGEVPHVEPPTDMNAYDGSEEDLRAEWAGN